MKTCKRCKIEKKLSDFYVHEKMGDGYLSFCKDCIKKQIRKYVIDNADMLSIREKERYQRRKLKPGFAEKKLEYQKKTRTPEKIRAANVVKRKLKCLKPKFCEKCKTREAKHGHHPDYSKPSMVEWLCVRCHVRLHKLKERTA